MSILSLKFENLSLFLNNKYYREFLRLLLKYGSGPRYREQKIHFLNYAARIPDALSFVFQFKEIFVKEYYLFESASEKPLIYDCGANIGISCLYFKKIYPGARIKAFEADPEMAAVLRENLKNNNAGDIEVIPKAIWITDDGIEFAGDGADGGSILAQGVKQKVDSVRLKSLLDSEERIDFLKMDIEGAETSVIPDCGDSLKKAENIFIEFHSFKGYPQNLKKIIEPLENCGFRYFIKSEENRKRPFINKANSQNPDMDLQLNIFAYKK